ncbi:MAG: sulfatase-like hydrolase/transferase [Paludibacter sp.]
MIYKKRNASLLFTGAILLSGTSSAQKPNIVIINLDDAGWGDPSCYGSTISSTPKIDFLATNGIKFNHCYVASSVSSPSRAALLTGCYPVRVGIPKVLAPTYANSLEGINPDEQLIPELLKPLGYATACVGKWHLGHDKVFLPPNHGFDEFFGLPYSNDMSPANTFDPATIWPNLPLIERYTTLEVNPDQRNLTKRYTERAVDFITRKADLNQPFFLYLAHSMPHTPLFVSDAFQNSSPNGLYSKVMAEIDWSVGEVLKILQQKGITNNTLIIFTSDNGPWAIFGNHAGSVGNMSKGKNTVFEGGHRVPCIMYWPNAIPAGQTSNEIITNMDFLPTICNITGASLPVKTIDGKNIISLMNGTPDATSPTAAFYYYNDVNLQAVRMGDLKMHYSHLYQSVLVLGNDGVRGTYQNLTQPEALFNVVTDPAESINIKSSNTTTFNTVKSAGTAFDTNLKANARAVGNSSKLPVPLDESPIYWTLDNSLLEKSLNGMNLTGSGHYEFSTDAKFGSHSLKLVAGQPGGLIITPVGGSNYFNKMFSAKTVSLWIKTSDTSGNKVIYEEGGTSHGITLKFINNQLTVGVVEPDATKLFSSQYVFTKKNEWVHLVMVFNKGNIKLYENTVKVLDFNATFTSIAAHTSDACIGTKTEADVFGLGAIAGGNNDNYTGLIDEVKVYDRALIPDEVVGLYTLNAITADEQTNANLYPTKLYPNPTKGLVYFKRAKQIAAFNLQGITLKESCNTDNMDLSALSKGVYMLRIDNENYKIIKE